MILRRRTSRSARKVCTIKYKSTTNNPIGLTASAFGDNITLISNTYDSASGYCLAKFDKDVTKIGTGSGFATNTLTEIILPDTVSYIDSSAFMNATSLNSVTLNNEISTINQGAFYGCTSLTTIAMPNNLAAIYGHAFSGCTSLQTITNIPTSLIYIENTFTYNCPRLEGFYGNFGGISSDHRCISYPTSSNYSTLCDVATYNLPNNTLTVPSYITDISAANFCKSTTIQFNTLTQLYFEGNIGSFGTSGKTYGLDNVHIRIIGFKYAGYITCDSGVATIIAAYQHVCFYFNKNYYINTYNLHWATYAQYVYPIVANNEIIYVSYDQCNFSNICGGSAGTTSLSITSHTNLGEIGPSVYLFDVICSGEITNIGANCSCNEYFEEIYFPKTLKYIGYNAFGSNSTTFGSFYAHFGWCDDLRSIGESAFEDSLFYGNLRVGNTLILNSYTGGYAGGYAVSIGDYAFYENCIGTLSIYGDNCSIGTGAFSYGYNITSIYELLGSNYTYGRSAFSNNTSLTIVYLGSGTTSIGTGAFSNCTNLSSFTINSPNCTFEEGFIYNTPKLYNFSISSSASTYSLSPDGRCIIQNNTLMGFAPRATSTSSGTITTYIIPSNITRIGWNVFRELSSITSVSFLSNLLSIGESSFENCTGLYSITFPSLLQSIERYAFRNCFYNTTDKLPTLPASLTTLQPYAFQNSKGTSYGQNISITSLATTPPSVGLNTDPFLGRKAGMIIYVPNSTAVSSYCLANGWKIRMSYIRVMETNNVVEYTSNDGNVISFSSDCCSPAVLQSNTYSGGVGRLTFDRDVTTMNNFSSKSMLYTIKCPKTVTSISSSAFRSCTSLRTVTLPNTSNSPGGSFTIGSSAFHSCSNLSTVDASTLTGMSVYINSNAFNNCYTMTSFSIPNSTIYSLGDYAFARCSTLSTVTMSFTTSPTIGEGPFSNCAQLTRFNFDTAHRSSDYFVFSNSTSIYGIAVAGITSTYCITAQGWSTYKVPSTNAAGTYTYTAIAPYACEGSFNYGFNTCKGISLPDSVVNINTGAFKDNLYLYIFRFAYQTTYTNMTSIADYAFYNCEQLEYIYNLEYVKNIGTAAFAYDYSIYGQKISTSQTSYSTTGHELTLWLGNFGNNTSSYTLTVQTAAFFQCENLCVVNIGGSIESGSAGSISKYCYLARLYTDSFARLNLDTFKIGNYCQASNVVIENYVFYENSDKYLEIYVLWSSSSSVRITICSRFKASTQDETSGFKIYNINSYEGLTNTASRPEEPSY